MPLRVHAVQRPTCALALGLALFAGGCAAPAGNADAADASLDADASGGMDTRPESAVDVPSVDTGPEPTCVSIAPIEWTQGPPLPTGRESSGVAIANGRLVVAGGWLGAGATDEVVTSHIGVDGSLGSWEPAERLPRRSEHLALVRVDTWLFAIGGDDGMAPLTTVARSTVDRTGALGAWMPSTELPAARSSLSAVVVGRDIYVFGGVSRFGGATETTVLRARVAPDGTLGEWMPAGSLPMGASSPSAAASASYVAITFATATGLRVATADVLADGALGSWTMQPAPTMPWRLAPLARTADALVTAAGFDGRGGSTSTYAARLGTDGTVGAWMPLRDLPAARFGSTLEGRDGTVYVVGGWTSMTQPPTDTVYIARVCATR